jgi:hypothetical protein
MNLLFECLRNNQSVKPDLRRRLALHTLDERTLPDAGVTTLPNSTGVPTTTAASTLSNPLSETPQLNGVTIAVNADGSVELYYTQTLSALNASNVSTTLSADAVSTINLANQPPAIPPPPVAPGLPPVVVPPLVPPGTPVNPAPPVGGFPLPNIPRTPRPGDPDFIGPVQPDTTIPLGGGVLVTIDRNNRVTIIETGLTQGRIGDRGNIVGISIYPGGGVAIIIATGIPGNETIRIVLPILWPIRSMWPV